MYETNVAAESRRGVLWSDRARWAGLPVLFERYTLDGEALRVSRGLVAVTEDRLLLYRVLDVRVRRGLLDRLLGLGCVTVYGADATDPVLELKGVRRPREVADLIQNLAEEARARAGVRGREVWGAFAGEGCAWMHGSGAKGGC